MPCHGRGSNFNAAAPDVFRAGDITYIPTGESWPASLAGRLLVAESSGELGSAHLRPTR